MSTGQAAEIGGKAALLQAARAELIEHGHAAISLRAVARRAGVSHAAPKYHFVDRAGLLTAVAADGFRDLTAALRRRKDSLEELGRAYIDYGLAHPALFDLMFRPSELHANDHDLQRAQGEAIGVLSSVAARIAPSEPLPGTVPDAAPSLALISWAFVHGLVVLARNGALNASTGSAGPQDAAKLAHALTDVFTHSIARSLVE